MNIAIPYGELVFTFVRSSGPGGQNVNKVNSKAVLRWRITESSAISEPHRQRILAHLAGRLTTEGDLIVMSDRFRDQQRNKDDCIHKLVELVAAASRVQKARKKTQPTRSSQKKKRESKARDSRKKTLRRRVSE